MPTSACSRSANSSSDAVRSGNHPLVLASTSPYRRTLLERLRLPFQIVAPAVDETALANETADTTAQRLAMAKAMAVARQLPDCIVIGSDQVADLDGQLLGKPGNHQRALEQLQQLSGSTVQFHTAVAVLCLQSGFRQTAMATARVRFRRLSLAEIDAYLRAEQPYDCAASAKSEGLGIALLESIDSDDPTTLIGLPLMRTCAMLRAAGIVIP